MMSFVLSGVQRCTILPVVNRGIEEGLESMATRFFIAIVILFVVTFAGCGRKAQIVDERKVVWQDSPYETLWVEPQIVLADSLMTLIRSDRIDSVLADPADSKSQHRASIEIRVFEPWCNVSAGLFDTNRRLVRPLLVRNLSTGFYRLTVNVDRFQKPSLPPATYYLKADFCDEIQMAVVKVE